VVIVDYFAAEFPAGKQRESFLKQKSDWLHKSKGLFPVLLSVSFKGN
jgi:hypothetical protein